MTGPFTQRVSNFEIMEWIVTIVLGLIAGIIGKFIMPGKDPGGLIITVLLGIGGACLGKFLGEKLGIISSAGKSFDLISLGVSVAGVIIILLIYRIIFGKK